MYRLRVLEAFLFVTILSLASCGDGADEQEDKTPPVSTATPAGGTYTEAQDVVLTCEDGEGSGCAAVFYTVDGSDPSVASASYTSPIAISEDTTLKFFATDLAGNAESTHSETYVIDTGPVDTTPPSTTAAPAGGTYTEAQDVVLTCDDGAGSGCAAIYYTLDGSNPTTGSSVYATPVAIADNTTLKFFAVDVAGNAEDIQTEAYVIDTDPPVTTPTPIGGDFDAPVNVVLACDDGAGSGCAATYYTLDGSDPDDSSSVYSGPLNVATNTTLRFFSEDLAGNWEDIREEIYVIDGDPPLTSATPPGGLYNAAQEVVLACDDGNGSGCTATYFTLDGSDPTTASDTYSDPISISADTTIKFFSVDSLGHTETIREESYVFDYDSPESTADPAGGNYNQVQNVVLTCDDGSGSGCANIYYTLDGSDPTTASTFYIDPIAITVDTTLKFFAADLAGNAETIQTEDYVIVAANWEPIGPYGGTIYDIAFDPDTPATAYAATLGGVFKTVDAGAHWAVVNHGLTDRRAVAIAVDPFDADRIIVGTSGGGVFRSVDGGITWEVLAGVTDAYIGDLAFDTTSGVVYVAGGQNVFKSDDGGDNWSPLATGSVNANFKAIAATGGTVYVSTWDDGVFRSANAGVDWAPVNTGLAGEHVNALVVDPANVDLVYAGTSASGVLKTSNGGTNWAPANTGLPSGIESLALDPADSDTVYAGSQGLFVTTDGGADWQPAGTGIPAEVFVNSIALEPGNPATLFSGTGRGLFKSTDTAANWAPSHQGIHALTITDMAFDPVDTDTIWVTTESAGVFKTIDAGDNWLEMNNGIDSTQLYSIAVDPDVPDTVLVGRSSGGVFKSSDGGLNWNPTYGIGGFAVNDLVFDPGNSDVVYAGLGGSHANVGVYKSEDNGDNWSNASTNLTGTSVRAVVIDPRDSDVLYASGDPCDGVFKSIDGAASWGILDTGLANDCFWSMIMDPNNPDIVYASGRTAFKSIDAGISWEIVDTGLPAGSIRDMAFVPDSSRIYAAHSYEGVYYSDDGGASWVEFNESLGTWIVNKVLVDPTEPALVYAGTESGSVWVYR
jgi:photosystem II stability/assembly factor-like uncharacterized protein